MEELDKKKMIRALIKAQQMNLSSNMQDLLSEAIQGKKTVTSQVKNNNEAPIFPLEKDESPKIPQEKFHQLHSLLKKEKTGAGAYFIQNMNRIFSDIPFIEDKIYIDFLYRMGQLRNTYDILKLTDFGKMLSRCKNDEDRLNSLEHMFENRSKHITKEDSLLFCLFLSDPLPWFQKKHEIWRLLSTSISDQIGILPSQCNLYGVYRSNEFNLMQPELEKALWEPLKDNPICPSKWKGVAYFHLYLASKEQTTDDLWTSWTFFQRYQTGEEDWSNLRKWANKLSITPETRTKLIRLSQLFPNLEIKPNTIQAFISEFGIPTNESLIESLLSFLKSQEAFDLKIQLYCALSSLRRLKDQELSGLIVLGKQLKNFRLSSSAEMVQFIHGSYKLSYPEFVRIIKRYHRPKLLDEQVFNKCLNNFSLDEKKFINSYVRIVPWFHYFNEMDNKEYRKLSLIQSFFDPTLRLIYRRFKKLPFDIPKQQLMKVQRISPSLHAEVPLFYQTVPDNTWGKTLAHFCQLLAFNDLEQNMLAIRESAKSYRFYKFRQWVDKSNKETRLNWQQLKMMSQQFSNERISQLLMKTICRFASLSCGDSPQSLWSLSQEGAPKDLLHDLESEILRESLES